MSIIGRFANQTVTLKRRITQESWEGNTYADGESIKARYEPDRGTVRTIGGDEVQARDYVLTETEVAIGDLIEDREVKRIKPAILKKGTLLGYQVWLG